MSLSLSALVLFMIANAWPFLTLRIEGREEVSTLFTGVRDLFMAGMAPLAVLVFLTSILLPLLKLLSVLYVVLPLRLGTLAPGLTRVFRVVETIRPWAMMDVYLLGVLVAYVELSALGQLQLGIAAFAFAALMLLMVALDAGLEPHEVWDRIDAIRGARDPVDEDSLGSPPKARLVACHGCQRVVAAPPDGARRPAAALRSTAAHRRCRRCQAPLHQRKPDSLATTWALLITAAILYVPANVYPVMTVISFGRGEPDTILSGVTHLIEGGQWPLAGLVFFASIAVPVLKLVGLAFLLVTVQGRSSWRPRDRTRLYRLIEGVGRWSMIDVFMISILVGLVKLGAIATIEPGIGAIAFAAVVVATMIASASFDPRLIWDNLDPHHGVTA